MNTIEDIFRWLEINELEHWKVAKSRGDKNDKVFETSDQENLAERKAKFKDVMKYAPSGYFYIIAKKSKTATTGLFENEFMNGATSSASVGNVANVDTSNFVPKSEINGIVNTEIEKYKSELKLQQLEAENKELKKELDENGGAIGRMIKRGEPVLNMLIDRFIPKHPPVQLAGLDYTPESEETEPASAEENERIQIALEKWNAADPEFIEVLEFIANFAATGKTISPFPMVTLDYNSIKGMLK